MSNSKIDIYFNKSITLVVKWTSKVKSVLSTCIHNIYNLKGGSDLFNKWVWTAGVMMMTSCTDLCGYHGVSSWYFMAVWLVCCRCHVVVSGTCLGRYARLRDARETPRRCPQDTREIPARCLRDACGMPVRWPRDDVSCRRLAGISLAFPWWLPGVSRASPGHLPGVSRVAPGRLLGISRGCLEAY